jgi:hypothetical protein
VVTIYIYLFYIIQVKKIIFLKVKEKKYKSDRIGF